MELRPWQLLPDEMRTKEVRKYYNILMKHRMWLEMKRVLDVIVAGIMLAVLIIPMGIIALAIRLDSPGPVFFRQARVTQYGRIFRIYKFRTMVDNASKLGAAVTVDNDSRITKVGAFLRKYRMDEFPQLFNVLKGDMSLVGPRPERPQYVEKFREEIPRYMIKHQVRPGMTGWAQVNGYRGDTSIRKRIEYDLYYIENWTLGLDIKILFLTVFKGFINKNAY